MTWKIISFVSLILIISSANSAVIVCTWSGETCTLNTGTLISQPNEVITISGKPAGYVNTVTTSLIISQIFVAKYIPANLFTIFKNLKQFQMQNCGLSNLAANFTASCPVLEQFIGDDANLQEIPEGFLQTCTNILFLAIRHSQVMAIDKNAFRGLAKLQQIELSNNRITCLHPDLFQHTRALTSAYFTYNKISAIDRNLFRNVNLLSLFDIRSNSLTYLPILNLTLPATTSISFYLSGNPIYAIDSNFCSFFANRMKTFDYFNVGSIPCLPKDKVFYRIEKQYCQSSASILQSCYANWVPTMADNVVCGQGSGVCISSNVLSKLGEFIKYLPV